jgi:hypothetical protein
MGPIAELRLAVRSPVALVVGACVGGAAPLLSYRTVHNYLIVDGRVEWRSVLWPLVAGALALSAKSVYRWGRQTFGDPYSAAALVAMLEGALLLSPDPLVSHTALAFLMAINAAVYGCALALQDQADKAAAAAAAAVVPAAPEPPKAPVKALAAPKPESSSSNSTPPKAPAGDLYTRAAELVARHSVVSTELVRTTLKVRQQTATELLRQLEADGVVGRPDPRDHHRRPVLLSVAAAE